MFVSDKVKCLLETNDVSRLSLSLDPQDPDLKFPDPGSEIRIQTPGSGCWDLNAFGASETALNGFNCNEFFHLRTLFLLLSIGGGLTEQ